MKIILVICFNIEELERLTSTLLRALKPLNAKWNNRKKELVVGDTKFRFVTESQNKDGIRYDKKMNSYEFYKGGDLIGKS